MKLMLSVVFLWITIFQAKPCEGIFDLSEYLNKFLDLSGFDDWYDDSDESGEKESSNTGVIYHQHFDCKNGVCTFHYHHNNCTTEKPIPPGMQIENKPQPRPPYPPVKIPPNVNQPIINNTPLAPPPVPAAAIPTATPPSTTNSIPEVISPTVSTTVSAPLPTTSNASPTSSSAAPPISDPSAPSDGALSSDTSSSSTMSNDIQ